MYLPISVAPERRKTPDGTEAFLMLQGRYAVPGTYGKDPLGRHSEASAVFDSLARDRFSIFPRDNEWLLGISLAADACYGLKDKQAASVLYEQLVPFTGAHAVGIGEGSVGAVDRYLGLLAALLGQRDRAKHHFEGAIRFNERMGSRPWAAHSQYDLARLLLTRGRPADSEQAADLLSGSLATARELGMTALTTRIERVS